MKLLINIILIILVIILQMSIIPKMVILGGYPNLILLVMISLVFVGRAEEGLYWLGIGGLLLDLVTPNHFGYSIFLLILIYFIAYITVKKFFWEPNIYVACLFFFLASIILDAIWLVTNFQWPIVWSDAIYNTVVGCIIYILIGYYLRPKESIKI